MTQPYERHIPLEGVYNFRDLGGYQTQDGRKVKWRSLFRGGEFQHMTEGDLKHIRDELGIATVVDLRSPQELVERGIGLISDSGIRHQSIPFTTSYEDSNQRIQAASNMGEVYLGILGYQGFGNRVIEALESIANFESHPVVFHCTAGKDRTGMLSAMVLSILGVSDEEIIHDYTLSKEPMELLVNRMMADPERAERAEQYPPYVFDAAPESISLFLSSLYGEHGSMKGYVMAQGANVSLFQRLEDTLLE